MPDVIVIIGEAEFRKWVVDEIMALKKRMDDGEITQAKIDEITAQILENTQRMEAAKGG